MKSFEKYFNKLNIVNRFKNIFNRFRNFDWFSILMYEEKIAGLAIDDEKISYVFLDKNRKSGEVKINKSVSLPIKEGTIRNGRLINKDFLTSTLAALLKELGGSKINSLILSLPTSLFYSVVLQFPKSLSNDQIKEAMSLNISFVLPLSPQEIYVDWQKIKSDHPYRQEIFLCLAKNIEIEDYLSVINGVGFSVVAVEPLALSAARVIKENDPYILLVFGRTELNISVIEESDIAFSRSVKFVDESVKMIEMKDQVNMAIGELLKIINFYESDKTSMFILKKVFCVGELNKEFLEKISLSTGISAEVAFLDNQLTKATLEANYIFGYGAAARGLISRSMDIIVSLMKVGTEKVYEEKKIQSFLGFLRDLSFGLSIFFVFILLGTYFFLVFVGRNISKEIKVSNSSNLVEIEKKAKDFNSNITDMMILEEKRIVWSKFLEKINFVSIEGVKINNVIITGSQNPVLINVFANKRENMFQFKLKLEELAIFEEVKLPFAALTQNENINFSLNLKLKDLSILKSE